MSEVILGMPGPWADNDYETSDHYTTKIGGLPDWPTLTAPMTPDILKCSECGCNLCLVIQIYAPLSNKNLTIEERVIYVFGCIMPRCGSTSKSWRALRVQKFLGGEESKDDIQEAVHESASSLSTTKDGWWEDLQTFDGENNEVNDDIDLEGLGRALSEAASLASHSQKTNSNFKSKGIPKLQSIKQTCGVIDYNAPVLPCFYIYNQKELFSKQVCSISSNNTPVSIKLSQNDHNDYSEEESWEEESYEYDKALNVDRTYLKFKKRLDAYPEQCFRYCFGGKPLLATPEASHQGTCGLCGGSRDFEVQLMPPLLYFLQEATNESQKLSFDNWSWLTLVIYTCSNSCSHYSDQERSEIGGWIVAEEEVFVQYE